MSQNFIWMTAYKMTEFDLFYNFLIFRVTITPEN